MVYEQDVDTDRPAKRIPGIEGRSAWFTARAGAHESALSLERLQRAIQSAIDIHDLVSLRDEVREDANRLLARVPEPHRARAIRSISLLDFAGQFSPVNSVPGEGTAGLTALSDPLKVISAGFLFVPSDTGMASDFDLDHMVLAEVSDPGHLVLNVTFSYWAEHQMFVGRIWHPGLYQVHALPKDPSRRSALETVARYWRWVAHDRSLRMLLADGRTPAQEIISRVGELIRDTPDPSDDVAQRPVFVKYLADHQAACSRWVSIGPLPDTGFRGIGRVSQLDIHPSNGNILIAGAAGGGVWRTDDGGDSWRPTMDLQITLTIGAVAIAPSNPAVMYAASGEDGGDKGAAWSGVGVYRSNNGGRNWKLMTGVPSTRFSAIVVHPKDPDTIYVAGNKGLHKSTDGGLTWLFNPGVQSLLDGQITDVVISYEEAVVVPTAGSSIPFALGSLNAEHVFAGVYLNGVFRSTTAGQQVGATLAFTRLDGVDQLPTIGQAGWVKLAVGDRGTHGSRFLAAKLGPRGSRIFVSIDRGTTWTERAKDVATISYDEWCSVIAVDPEDENVMYAGAAGALKCTINGGATPEDWTSINAGIHADQQDIVFDPHDPQRMFLANDGGIYRSTNRGTDWSLASGLLAITQCYDIDISEKDRDIVAAGAQDNGIYYRDSSGLWKNIKWGDGTQVAIDPTDPQIFYFSAQEGLQDGVPKNVRRSINGGASHQKVGQSGLSGDSPWSTILKLEPRDPIDDPANNRVVFVCGLYELFRSTDGGQKWRRVEDATGKPFQSSGEITSLEFALKDPSILYLGDKFGAVYRSVNGGATASDWTRIDTFGSPANALFPTAGVQAIGVHRRNPNHVWLVFGGSGVTTTGRPEMILNPLGISHVFRSTNATDPDSWEDASGRFPALSLPDVPTSAIALDDDDFNVAYVGTDVGVFRTTDGGMTWTAFQDGLPRSPVVELRLNRKFNRLFAATMGRGVFVRDVRF
jgi:photosystem II stability/assembly factor-like uncharacterized protein